ncbi:MAG: Gfo/Idh/MocA family oxidoreductase [bacterium]|nr:Gfo/Idh/MocA family oxidoreductase [bacterium]
MRQINCGLIGLGNFGKHYFRLLKKTGGAELCVVASRTESSFLPYKEQLAGTKTTIDTEDIYNDPKVDAVFIVTPASTHFDLIKKALASGKHVFVEKPMVLDLSDAKRVKEVVEKTKKKFMVGYQYVFNDNVNYLKKEIEKGTFGKIISVTNEHAVSPPSQDIDIFWDVAPHSLSVLKYIFNPGKVVGSEGKINHDDASVKISFENSPQLEINALSFGDKKIRKLTFIGEKGTAVLDETLEKNKLSITVGGKTAQPEIDVVEPLQREIEHFIHCIQTAETPLTDVNFGSQITEWLETISKKLG